VLVEPPVRLGYQRLAESLLRDSGFVAGHQKNRLPVRIKCIGNAPDAVRRVEAQFLHVCVLGRLERIGEHVQAAMDDRRPGAFVEWPARSQDDRCGESEWNPS
jgi:hypothetical protein